MTKVAGSILTGVMRRHGLEIGAAAVLLAVALLLAGCDDDASNCDCIAGPDHQAPAAPRGLESVTGDEEVRLSWYPNTERDLAGYHILINDTFAGDYDVIASIDPCSDCDWESYTVAGLTNGQTYFFAVIAFDDSGNESAFCIEEVSDTPRPQGTDVTISNALIEGGYDLAGFDLSAARRVSAGNPDADFFYEFEGTGAVRLLVAGSDALWPDDTAKIQDMGWTRDFDEIGYAPDEGWALSNTVEAIADHSYVLLTRNGQYAKIRLTSAEDGFVTFDWALQTERLNRQLAPAP